MAKILFINACVRDNSRTLELANHVLSELQGDIEEINLFSVNIPTLDKKGLKARENASIAKDYSSSEFLLAKQFASAEIIVIGAPYWDLMFPAVLKNYFENITVSGLTFDYSKKGMPYGLCNAKRLIYVTTAGGPIVYNFGFDYVSALAKNFYGIPSIQLVKAEGLDICGANVSQIIKQAKQSFKL